MTNETPYSEDLYDDPYTREPIELNGCTFKMVCFACPESYDVFLNNEQIGSVRLRHGTFRAWYPDLQYNGEVVYEARPIGDGIFECNERKTFLHMAAEKLRERHERSRTNHDE